MPFTSQETIELAKRIKLAIEYSRQPCVVYKYTKPAYQDLSSMGTPYTEPAAEIDARRPMTPQETTDFIMGIIANDEILRNESIEHLLASQRMSLYCKNRRGSNDPRCMRCGGCAQYESVMQSMSEPDHLFS